MTGNTGFTWPKCTFLPILIRYRSYKGIWAQLERATPTGLGKCDRAQLQGLPEPVRQGNKSWEMLGGTKSPSSQALSAPSWASPGWQKRGRWNSHWFKKKKEMHTANSSLYYQLNFPKRISKVLLNHSGKWGLMLAWQMSNHIRCALQSGHHSHELFRMISQSGPALGRLPEVSLYQDKALGRQSAHHCRGTSTGQRRSLRHHAAVDALRQGLRCGHL